MLRDFMKAIHDNVSLMTLFFYLQPAELSQCAIDVVSHLTPGQTPLTALKMAAVVI